MSMFSEIATEGTIRNICQHIEAEMFQTLNNETLRALRAVGRKVLTEFEWDTPEWAATYAEKFRERAS